MNNPIVRDWAAGFAGRLRADGRRVARRGGPARLPDRARPRRPTAEELADAVGFPQAQQRAYRPTARPTPASRPWPISARSLMGLNEFIYIE